MTRMGAPKRSETPAVKADQPTSEGNSPISVRANVGKRVGGALYLHKSALKAVSAECRANVKRAQTLAGTSSFNVIKVRGKRISLLLYEDFDASAFPALLEAHTVDLSQGSVSRSSHRTS